MSAFAGHHLQLQTWQMDRIHPYFRKCKASHTSFLGSPPICMPTTTAWQVPLLIEDHRILFGQQVRELAWHLCLLFLLYSYKLHQKKVFLLFWWIFLWEEFQQLFPRLQLLLLSGLSFWFRIKMRWSRMVGSRIRTRGFLIALLELLRMKAYYLFGEATLPMLSDTSLPRSVFSYLFSPVFYFWVGWSDVSLYSCSLYWISVARERWRIIFNILLPKKLCVSIWKSQKEVGNVNDRELFLRVSVLILLILIWPPLAVGW